ncbi:MAG: hypothetical protein HKN05_03390, partial [Rhizobiales bacterium]|nr:hypothetical protein [Hyphomicrobiales bacterium]
MRYRLKGCIAFFAILFVQPATAVPAPNATEEKQGGRVVATINGRTVPFPSLKTEISGDLKGDLASITVRQTFVNPTNVPMNARYLFPLNKNAAVHAMQMRVGDELISAKIAKRAVARTTYEKAKSKGKAAALLEQHRPNMFTQEIANLMPGAPVVITLRYSQVVPRIDNAYELRVPLVVGPRYIPSPKRPEAKVVVHQDEDMPARKTAQESAPGGWQFGPVPTYPAVAGLDIPTTVLKERVSVKLN